MPNCQNTFQPVISLCSITSSGPPKTENFSFSRAKKGN